MKIAQLSALHNLAGGGRGVIVTAQVKQTVNDVKQGLGGGIVAALPGLTQRSFGADNDLPAYRSRRRIRLVQRVLGRLRRCLDAILGRRHRVVRQLSHVVVQRKGEHIGRGGQTQKSLVQVGYDLVVYQGETELASRPIFASQNGNDEPAE